ncbi:MAG: serine/threonine protein kinase [Planctomycetota bacterium]|nr:MAG: serine/threonine protein kinase [Planctomycetota bacterium]
MVQEPDSDVLEDLMAQCLAAPPEHQRALLEELGARRPEWAEELRRRLAALEKLGVLADAVPEGLPEQFGEFRILERLGGGGMGVVYRAEQRSLRREVALKVVRPEHLWFPEARRRFQREVEAVAALQHPGVVPIFAVGEEGGVPYFVMERIRGCTLAEALDQLRGSAPESLSGRDLARVVYTRAGEPLPAALPPVFEGSWTSAGLRLAAQVADALEHCHQRGIVHRDVKPSNVALAVDGRVLLLDFGLASQAQADALTRSGAQVGTLFYMAPEQLRGRAEPDARSDVYALGVSLYELLALQLPFQEDSRPATEARILHDPPDPLRARNRRVPRDAEVVCLHALEKEPARRYASAGAFAADLRSVLERRPIRARPPGPLLRARRLLERRPAASAAVLLGALLLAGTPTALLLQSQAYSADLEDALSRESDALLDAQEQVRRFQHISRFLEGLFWVPDPDRGDGAALTAREILDRGVHSVRTELADQPATRASLLHVMGSVYHKLGLYAPAEELLRESLALADAAPEAHAELLPRALTELGTLETRLERFDDAEARLRRSLELTAGASGALLATRSETWITLGRLYSLRGERAAAQQALLAALEVMDGAPPALAGELAGNRGAALGQLGIVLLGAVQSRESADPQQDLARSEQHLREALDWIGQDPAPTTLLRATALNALALNLKLQGRLEQAESCYQTALESFRALLGGDDDRVASVLLNLSGLRMQRGQLEDALDLAQQALAIFRRVLPEGHSATVIAQGNRAGLLYRLQHWDEAEQEYEVLIPLQEQAFGALNLYLPASWRNLGECRARRGAVPEAEAALRRAAGLYTQLGHPEEAAAAEARLEQLRSADG